MPYEIIQRPNDTHCPTEVSVRWEKDHCFVQLKVERQDPVVSPDSAISAISSALTASILGTSTPEPADRLPVGTVKAAEDGSQIAIKSSAFDSGKAVWTVIRGSSHPPRVEACSEADIEDWPVVRYPDDRPVPATIWTPILTRGEINNFIRTLRRARDAAYGADA